MAGGERCEPVVATWSGSGTGESYAQTVSGKVYSMGPHHASNVVRGKWCTCDGRKNRPAKDSGTATRAW